MFGNYMKKSLKRRFNVILITLILALFSSLLGGVLYYNHSRTLQIVSYASEVYAKIGEWSAIDPIWGLEDETLEKVAKSLRQDSKVVFVAIFDADDEEMAKDIEDGYPENFEAYLGNSMYITQKVPVMKMDIDPPEQIGTIKIVTNIESAIQESITVGIFLFVIIILVMLIVALIVNFVLGKVVLNPLSSLGESAHSIAEGNYDTHISGTHRRDEIGTLAKDLLHMKTEISEKITDLNTINNLGEALARIHEQSEALTKALGVFHDKLEVEFSSVYLVNEEGKLEYSGFFPIDSDRTENVLPRSFEIGEGICGKSAKERKIIYVENTANSESFVEADKSNARSLLSVPMFDEDTIFGVMNFSAKVGNLQLDASDEDFASTIARITVNVVKNIQFVKQLDEYNRQLETKVEERTSELRQKTNDINNMLQNMHQGIFTIVEHKKKKDDGSPENSDYLIHPEYSKHLEQILGASNLQYKDFFEIVVNPLSVGVDAKAQLKATIESAIGEDPFGFDCNKGKLFREAQHEVSGRQKILEFDWDPIMSDDGFEVEKLMVTVRDVTAVRALEAEADKQKEELEMIGEILSLNLKTFQNFLKSSDGFITQNKELIHKERKPEIVAQLFRNMHTIKGNARTYGLKHITDIVHSAEQTYDQLRKDLNANIPVETLHEELQQVAAAVGSYEVLLHDKLGALTGENQGLVVKPDLLDALKKVLSVTDDTPPEVASMASNIQRLMFDLSNTTAFSDSISEIISSIPEMAEKIGIPIPEVSIKSEGIRVNDDLVPILGNIFVHMVGNSFAHGIEPSEERLKSGKSECGSIQITIEPVNNCFLLKYSDDGRGLPLEMIFESACENGTVSREDSLTNLEKANLIFSSGLTTKGKADELSGRGVGMDAIKRFLNRMEADILIELKSEANASGYTPFEFLISLPGTQVQLVNLF